jgi:MFS family permease
VWLALKNRVFFRLWLASLISGVCVGAHSTVATWLMHMSTGPSTLLLSLLTTAASLPFFLFTFPAGALADLSNRRALFIATYIWLASAAGLLAVFAWLHLVHRYVILATAFLMGTGFAFNAPVWACVIPEIVRKEEIASAITLGGVQMNFAGIVGPALGSLLLPIVGPPIIFALNALAFLSVAWVIFRVYHAQRRPNPHLENFLESFASALRYVQYTPGIQVILEARLFIRAFHRGGSRASASCRPTAFAAYWQSTWICVHCHGNPRGGLAPSLWSGEDHAELTDNSSRRATSRGSGFDGHCSKSLDISARGGLGRR